MSDGGDGDLSPNTQQRRLVENTDGVYLVDAGAGTGKTFAVTRRYAEIIDQEGVEPDDVLLVTFTKSAATEMRERIVDRSEYGLRHLADAPISTFHAHCLDLLEEHGYDAPAFLGLDGHVTSAMRLVEDDLVEDALFAEFLGQFRDANPEHRDHFRAIEDTSELLDLVKELAAKGVFPTASGWYRDCERHLLGDFDAFVERFRERNRPRNGGSKQSKLRDDLSDYGRGKTYRPEAPKKSELRGERGTKQLQEWVAREAFEEDREDLAAFVHDVYFEYLEFALERDVLNFAFLQLFAFVLLCEDDALRDRVAYDYVMVDEFQDTSEIQFKLALLLAGTDNLCLVGDWKQSIFSFQYADVDNIREFEDRLARFSAELNDDVSENASDDVSDNTSDDVSDVATDIETEDGTRRVTFEDPSVERIELTENYRSTGTILDFSEEALVAPATGTDDPDDAVLDDVVSLSSNAPFDETTIEAIQHPDEHEAVLAKVQEIVDNDDYVVEDEDGNPVAPSYGDVAVLTRTRDFGRDLLAVADEYDFPLAYDGEVELFRTDPAKLLLAWLRILESDAERGWAVVLERAGYALDEIEHVLARADYPDDVIAFREVLDRADSVGTVARRVFDRYGFDGEVANVVLDTIQATHDATTLTRGDLIRFLERGIENGSTHAVDTSAGDDAVTVQTIHAAKGLEYPIVILANMNDGAFPPNARDSGVLLYDEVLGIRQRKEYADVEAHPHVYHDWCHDVLRHCRPEEYDEERRLLYVAMTRAEHHLVFAAGEEPNAFLEALPVEIGSGSTDVTPVDRSVGEQAQLPFAVEPPDGPVGLSPHDLVDDVFDERGGGGESVDGRGTEFGTALHEFAEEYANDRDVTPDDGNVDERNVARFLEGLDGELLAERRAVLPVDVDGQRVTVAGVVDLVHVTPDAVEVIDYKTDRTRRAHEEHAKQLSIYSHVLAAAYPDRPVSASVYYTADDERVPVEPLPMGTIEALVRSTLEQ